MTTIGDYAFESCKAIINITIPYNVTSVSNNMFSCCENLTSITLPDNVKNIGDAAFLYCYSLSSITIPNSVTSIGDFAFGLCSALTTVNYLGDYVSWQGIEIGANNDYLLNAELVFFSGNGHGVKIKSTSNGSISLSTNYAEQGEVITVTPTANAGYVLKSIKVNGNLLEPVNNVYSFTMPDEVVTVTAEFEKLYTITAKRYEGSLTTSSKQSAANKEITLFEGENLSGKAVSVYIDGNELEPTNNVYKFTMPEKDIEIVINIISETVNNPEEPTSLAITDSKCTDDSIKFISYVNINKNDTVDTFGTVFIPLHLFNTSASMAKVEYSASENPIKSGDTFGATLNNIPDGYSDVFFVGKSYIKLDDNTVIWSKAKKVSIDEPTLRKVAE